MNKFVADRPITSVEEDLLGRSDFANMLGEAIYKYDSTNGLVVGLYGKWGSGKTSVVNMALNKIENLAYEDANKPLIVKFSPWSYSDKSNLISLFFNELKNKLKLEDDSDFNKKLGKALVNYSSAFNILSVVPIAGAPLAEIVKQILINYGQQMQELPSLDESRDELKKVLIESGRKIIVVIDDIDRLTGEQIRDIFQLVKQVGDFPNITYLLVMERDTVCKSLAEVHNTNGEEYLDKIVQVPFELPELTEAMVKTIFRRRLEKLIFNKSYDVEINECNYSRIYNYCISPYVKTLRDINRVMNIFEFKYGVLYPDVCFEDMVAITCLEVLEPKLYRWIAGNKVSVCPGYYIANNKQNDLESFYSRQFTNLELDSEKSLSCVANLFPVFSNATKIHSGSFIDIAQSRKYMRISDPEKFELYFTFNLGLIEISRGEVVNCLFELNEELLAERLKFYNSQGKMISFFDQAMDLRNDIPKERRKPIISVLFSLSGEFSEEETGGNYGMSTYELCNTLIFKIIELYQTEEDIVDVLEHLVSIAGNNEIASLAYIFKEFIEDGSNVNDYVLSQIVAARESELFDELKKICIGKVMNLARNGELLSTEKSRSIIDAWKFLDNDGLVNFVKENWQRKPDLLRFYCSLIYKVTSTNNDRWSVSLGGYYIVTNKDDLINTINNLSPDELRQFSYIEQTKLAAIVLSTNEEKLKYIEIEEARRLADSWIADEV